MSKKKNNLKVTALKSTNSLNPYPEMVKDKLFQENDFFDPNDQVQVKYEMLRKVIKDNEKITIASKAFGFSRISFYRIHNAFCTNGFAGLLPIKRGPKEAHKLNDKIMSEVARIMAKDKDITKQEIQEYLMEEFGVTIHRRTLERALDREGKKNDKKKN